MSEPDLTPPVYCIKCKAEIPGDAISCPRCGQNQRERVLPPEPGAGKPARRMCKSESGALLMLIGWAILFGVQMVLKITGVLPAAVTISLSLVAYAGTVVFFFGVYRLVVGRRSGD